MWDAGLIHSFQESGNRTNKLWPRPWSYCDHVTSKLKRVGLRPKTNDGLTDNRWTDATKYIISLASQSIIIYLT